MATAPFTATQLLRPASPLLRNPIIAGALGTAIKAQNRYDDPYAVARAIGSLGEGYDAMNKSLIGGVAAQRATELEDAYRTAGFYPAAAEAAVSGAQHTSAVNRRDIGGIQDIQQAFQAAVNEGLRPGTPQFSLFMHDHLTTARGVGEDDKTYQAARKQLEREQGQHTAIETGMKQLMRQRAAQQYINEHQNDYYLQTATPKERAEAQQRIQRDATAFADQQLEGHELQLTRDPQTGAWSAKTDDGRMLPIPPQLAAVAAKIGGDPSMYDALKGVYDMSRTADANARANMTTAANVEQKGSQVDVNQARAQELANRQAHHDLTKNNPMLRHIEDNLKDLRAQLKAAVTNGDTDEVKRLTGEIADESKRFETLYVHLGNTLPSATGPAPGASVQQQRIGPQYAPTAPNEAGVISLPAGGPRMPTGDYGDMNAGELGVEPNVLAIPDEYIEGQRF